jgi:ABC-2 type transport system ATP-binding protein
MSDYAIRIHELAKSFGKLTVLNGINLNVERGRMLALLGPNGAGKTTTVRILSTLIDFDAGEVVVNGFDVARQPNDVRHSIGLTGQYAAVDQYLTGEENLVMMGRLYHLSKQQARVRAKELLEQFDLVDAAQRAAKTYSGGMRRRLDLAASLVATPPIVFLDEPTTGLDPRSRLAMWDIIETLMKHGTTILLTTQYLEEADKLADRIAVIDHGKVIAEGTSDQLKEKVGKERLELVVAKESDFTAALKALEQFGTTNTNAETRTISVTTNGTVSGVKQVLNAMEQAKVDVDTLSLHKPTLDDVFMHLTGHEATEENAKKSV